MAYLIEETKGAFPLWLAPVQVKVLPVSDKSMDYAAKINRELMAQGVRSELDERNEKIGYKIRYARQEDKVPYMVIIGEKEIAEGTLAVRDRATDQTTSMTMEAFIAKLEKEIEERS
jgi:threonyl-tRNA synthetase